MRRRVVVTGMGCVSPLGSDVPSSWQALVAGKSGIRTVDTFDVSDLPTKVAGLLPKDISFDGYLEPKEQRKYDRFVWFALAAAKQAFQDAAWDQLDTGDRGETSVIIGSGVGGLQRIFEASVGLDSSGPRRGVSPFFIPSVIGNMASGVVSIHLGLGGANYSITSACSSSAHSIGEAFHKIRDGYCDRALAGGAESVVCRLGVAGFCAARALSTHFNDCPEKASRPWDKARDGFVMAEGSAVLALETLESARARGAKIYAEIKGYGASSDAYHITAPDPSAQGATRCLNAALSDAELSPEDVGYINAHGTSTIQGDIAELKAIKSVFGSHSQDLLISSTKSATGHMLGAAGAMEAIFSIQALQEGVVPATLNLDDPDDGCDLNLVPNKPQRELVQVALSNSFGFGGTNGTLIFAKV